MAVTDEYVAVYDVAGRAGVTECCDSLPRGGRVFDTRSRSGVNDKGARRSIHLVEHRTHFRRRRRRKRRGPYRVFLRKQRFAAILDGARGKSKIGLSSSGSGFKFTPRQMPH
jgi:hypothetical protein